MTTTNLSTAQRYRSVAQPSTNAVRRTPSAWQMFVFPRPVGPLPGGAAASPQGSNDLLRLDSPHASAGQPHYLLNWTDFVGSHVEAPLDVTAASTSDTISEAARSVPAPQASILSSTARLSELLAEAAHDIRSPIATAQQILGSIIDRSRAGFQIEQRDIKLLDGANLRLLQANRWSEEILAERNLTQRTATNIRRRFYPEQLRRGLQPLLESIAEKSAVTLEWIGWDRSMPRMYLDPDLLSRVLVNLVTNAAEASRPESRVAIRVAWQQNVTQRLLVTVEDQGMGLDAQLMRQMNSSKPWPERVAGTPFAGIGLRTVKMLMESMGGSVSVQRGTMGGTMFRLALPVDELRSLVRGWIVQNAAAARRDQRTRLTMHSIKTVDMDGALVDRELQRMAKTNDFVYRVAADHWLWLTLVDSVNSRAEDIYSTTRRLREIGQRSKPDARCDTEMFFSMNDLPFAGLNGTSDQGQQLPFLTQLILGQFEQQLDGRVPPIDEIFPTDRVALKAAPAPAAAAAAAAKPIAPAVDMVEESMESSLDAAIQETSADPAAATISEIAKQWRVIHSKLEHLHRQHLKPAPML